MRDVPSVAAYRTNDPRRISSDKCIRGNVFGDYRSRRDDRVLAYGYTTDDGRTGGDPHVFLNHDGFSDGGASLRGFKGMARRDDTYVRSDQHIVFDAVVLGILCRVLDGL